jgi:hypothetical protein
MNVRTSLLKPDEKGHQYDDGQKKNPVGRNIV